MPAERLRAIINVKGITKHRAHQQPHTYTAAHVLKFDGDLKVRRDARTGRDTSEMNCTGAVRCAGNAPVDRVDGMV